MSRGVTPSSPLLRLERRVRRRAEVLNDLSFSAVSVSFSLAFFDASRVALARAFEQSRILHGRQMIARSRLTKICQ